MEDKNRRTPNIRRNKIERRYHIRRDEEERRQPIPPSNENDMSEPDLSKIHEGDLDLLQEIEDDK